MDSSVDQPGLSEVSPKTPRIFVSHSSADKTWCMRFVRHLRAAGADVWWDVDDLGLGGFTEEIERQIESRPYFIVVLSPKTYERPWVQMEVGAAINLRNHDPVNRYIVPVMAHKCDLPTFLGTFQGIVGGNDLRPKQAATRVIRLLQLEPVSVSSPRLPRPRSETLDDAVVKGRSLLTQGRPQEALDEFEFALKMDESSVSAWFGKGRALHDLRRLNEAMKAYDEAIAHDALEPNAWAGRGYLNADIGDLAAALRDLDHALKLKPDYIAPLLNRSVVLRRLGRLTEALANADDGVNLAPTYGPGLANRARILHDLSRDDEALIAYDEALRAVDAPDMPTTTPTDWRALTLSLKADVLKALHCPVAAISTYAQALQRDESCTPAWMGKGAVHWVLGQYREAFTAYEHVLTLTTDPAELAAAWNGKGAALLGLRQFADAKAAFRQALDIRPECASALHGLADALNGLEVHPEAMATYQQALALGTLDAANAAEAWNSMSRIALFRGDSIVALSYLDNAIDADPSNIRFWSNKIHVLKWLNLTTEAESTQVKLCERLISQSDAASARNPNLHISDPNDELT